MRTALRSPQKTNPNYDPERSIPTVASPSIGTSPPQYFHPPTEKKNNIPHFVYAVAGLLAVGILMVGLIVAVMMSNSKTKEVSAIESPTPKSNVASTSTQSINSNASNLPSSNSNLSPSGHWFGSWTSKTASFNAEATFTETAGKVSGQIIWTIQRTSNPKKMDKIGTTAVEYVQGTFDSQTQMIDVRGFRKDDANNIIILDKYHLSIADDNQTIVGKSINGQFTLKR